MRLRAFGAPALAGQFLQRGAPFLALNPSTALLGDKEPWGRPASYSLRAEPTVVVREQTAAPSSFSYVIPLASRRLTESYWGPMLSAREYSRLVDSRKEAEDELCSEYTGCGKRHFPAHQDVPTQRNDRLAASWERRDSFDVKPNALVDAVEPTVEKLELDAVALRQLEGELSRLERAAASGATPTNQDVIRLLQLVQGHSEPASERQHDQGASEVPGGRAEAIQSEELGAHLLHLISQLGLCGMGAPSPWRVSALMQAAGCGLSSKHWAVLARACAQRGEGPERILVALVQWAGAVKGVAQGAHTSFESMNIHSSVKAVLAQRSAKWRRALLRSLSEPLGPLSFKWAVSCALDDGHAAIADVLEDLEELVEAEDRRRVVYNYALHKLEQRCDLEGVLAVYARMRAAGVVGSARTMNILVAACEARGDWQRVLEVVRDMRALGMVDAWDLATALMMCSHAAEADMEQAFEDIDAACELVSDVTQGVAPGHMSAPTAVMYSQIARCLARHGECVLLETLVERVVSSGRVPPPQMYKEVFSAFNRSEQWGASLEHFRLMRSRGHTSTKPGYHRLLFACGEKGFEDDALEVLEESHRHDLMPVSRNMRVKVLLAYLKKRDLERAERALLQRELFLTDSLGEYFQEYIIVTQCHVDVFCALWAWQHLPKPDSLKITRSLSRKLVLACAQHRKLEEGIALLERIDRPLEESVYRRYVAACTRAQKLELAAKTLDLMGAAVMVDGVTNSSVYAEVIDAHSKLLVRTQPNEGSKHMCLALDVLDKMEAAQVQLDGRVLFALSRIGGRLGHRWTPDDMPRLLRHIRGTLLEGGGMLVSPGLMRACTVSGEREVAGLLLERLLQASDRTKGDDWQASIYAACAELIEACIAAGERRRAASVLEAMPKLQSPGMDQKDGRYVFSVTAHSLLENCRASSDSEVAERVKKAIEAEAAIYRKEARCSRSV
ncbi:hypothetical protein CYMTET_25061 [Cymbomonas tetramitiformis]|uniref:Pentatricopeptide repeat-containing protein n=1 Tax=Cymbomonas tetramitiformis TaxID=36881 RepID=A0AAE0FUI8_9CHLO|nr:hypothetical protein CYMTET_25061 [Cymbomonas tetramitiformis]